MIEIQEAKIVNKKTVINLVRIRCFKLRIQNLSLTLLKEWILKLEDLLLKISVLQKYNIQVVIMNYKKEDN